MVARILDCCEEWVDAVEGGMVRTTRQLRHGVKADKVGEIVEVADSYFVVKFDTMRVRFDALTASAVYLMHKDEIDDLCREADAEDERRSEEMWDDRDWDDATGAHCFHQESVAGVYGR